jgi:hypothetical protein
MGRPALNRRASWSRRWSGQCRFPRVLAKNIVGGKNGPGFHINEPADDFHRTREFYDRSGQHRLRPQPFCRCEPPVQDSWADRCPIACSRSIESISDFSTTRKRPWSMNESISRSRNMIPVRRLLAGHVKGQHGEPSLTQSAGLPVSDDEPGWFCTLCCPVRRLL